MPVAHHLIVHGRVQGVWYRNWTVDTARDLGLAGWVRNRDDGTVEIFVEGEENDVAQLHELAQDGPSAADVTKIEKREVAVEGHATFEKRH